MEFTETFKNIVATEARRFETSDCPERRRTATQIVASMLHAAVFEHRLTPSQAVAIARESWPSLPWWNLLGALHGTPHGSAQEWEKHLSHVILSSPAFLPSS